MVPLNLPIRSRNSGEDLYTSFLEAYDSDEETSPVIFESEQISLRFCRHPELTQVETQTSNILRLVDDSASCPEMRKIAEAARKAASLREFKPHGFVEHILGMGASLVGISLLAGFVVGVLAMCAIVIGVILPFGLV